MDPARTFLDASRTYLQDTYLPRIARALEVLPEADLWWSPHPETPSVGNLLLHLEGNVRQWILSGLGGAPDQRERALEFAPGTPVEARPDGAALLAALETTVREACTVLDGLRGDTLLERREVQSFDATVLEAIYHVVEHFSWHTGQITTIAKQRAGAAHGLAFFDEARVNAARNAPSPPVRDGGAAS